MAGETMVMKNITKLPGLGNLKIKGSSIGILKINWERRD